ncbi:Sacsin [Holothuria leucospilota]|uniref:Sacsin n=1 Tax=Holothuria leucospilota TaxID=206669 RepID=A0A9Q0YRH6_HOLLE|nr:Sacsin [Holothuria leucospilota]
MQERRRGRLQEMAASIRGDAFGPQPPPLLEYLQQILRGYSDGQILKELLQNAEDAGASEVKFIYDKRQFGTTTLFEPTLSKFQGPALLAFNNAEFSDEDWGAIQRPARSDKKENALKVGRFGIGFSSVYHLTDLPCIISGSSIAIIDPFEEHFTSASNRAVPGSKWNLADVSSKDACSDQLAPFRNAFQDQEKIWQGDYSLKGTIFRFPLRRSPSALCSSVYSEEKMEELLDSFKQEALVVLLFLRNVEKISVVVRESFSNQPSPYLDVRVTSEDMSTFRNLRKDFCEMLEGSKGFQENDKDIELSVKFEVNMDDHSCPKVSERWISCQVIAYHCSKELKDLACRLHFLPWVGVAIALNEKHSAINQSSTHLDGRIFCFLPLPHGEASLSGLPVHVHGYFAVSDDRRSLKWPGGDQIQNETALWNRLLIEDVLPGVYLKAVLKAIDVCREEGKGPGVVYSALPNIRAKLGNWEGMVNLFYKEIFRHPVLYVESKKTWEHIDKVVIDSMSDCDLEARRVILKCLTLGGFLVAENLPRHVLEAIKQFANNSKFVNAQDVLSSLRVQRLDHFGLEEKLYLITYLLHNNCTAQDLNGLELLPVRDGQFTKFVAYPKSEDMVYLPTNQCKDELLPHLKQRFVGSLKSEFRGLQQFLNAMGRADQWKQLQELTPKLVVSLLKQTLPREWKGEYSSTTILDEQNGIFHRSWLSKLWEFAFHNLRLSELEGLNLLPITEVAKNPVQVVTLRQGSRVVSCSSVERIYHADVVTVLSRLGVIVCDLPLYVTKHYDLIGSHFAHQFDSNGVMYTLRKTSKHDIERLCQDDPNLCEKFHRSLLPFLNCFNMTNEDRQFMKNLQIFQACEKVENYSFTSISSGVSLLEEGWEERLPAVSLPRMLLLTKHEGVRSFCRHLGINEMREADIVKEILTSFQKGRFFGKEKQTLISWIGTSFSKICQIEGILDILKLSSFLPNGAGQERRVCDTFAPSDDLLKTLLNDIKYFPKDSFLKQDGGVWTDILPRLGYLTRNDVDQHHLKKVADEISLHRRQDQANALCRFLASKPELLRSKLDRYNTLGDHLRCVAFLQCRRERPVDYPRHLPFHGELTRGSLFTPMELVEYIDNNWQLAGSSALLADVVLANIGIRKEPSVEEVCEHLKRLIEHFSVTLYQDTVMLHAIYNFLNGQTSRMDISCYLPQKWIWTDDGFKSPAIVCLEDTVIDLRPFIFVIPREYRNYRELYKAVQISANVTTHDLLKLLGKAKTKLEFQGEKDTKRLIDLAIRILRRLLETEVDLKHYADKLFVPTKCNELLAPEEVSFCDYDWLKHSQLTGEEATQVYNDIKLISDQFSISMATRLGVVPLSSRVAMADEIVDGISQTGQYESITTRIRNILSDAGYQSTSIPKEMIQNAEDAGATEVRFLIDLRSNEGARKRLLDQGMEPLQGPALWVYNNSVFSDSDLQNIKKLGGGTKSDDASKIGRFGLGFNSVYHITDVPSFVTRRFVNFFDPHRKFLQSQIRKDGRGICLDFKKNPRVTMMFRDQFQPYDGIFDCHLTSTSPEEYPATLFRLPLRGPNEARDSEICREYYTEPKLKLLMKSICDTSNQMLLFTEKVKSIEVHLLKDKDGVQTTLLFSATKETINQTPTLSLPFREEVYKNVQDTCGSIPPNTVFEINIKDRWTETGRRYFQETSQENKTEEWISVMSAGKGSAISLSREKIGIEAGLIPYGGIAWKKSPPNEKLEGQVFCCLPLSVPNSHLPVHINGSFALSDDRAKLWRDSSNSIDTKASFKSKWNRALFEDVILSAYLTFLEQDTVGKFCCDSDKRYCLWPNLNETSTNGDYGILVSSFYSAVVKGLYTQGPPSIFWNTNEQRRLAVHQIAFLDQRFERNEKEFRVASGMITRKTKARMVLRLPRYVNDGFLKADCSAFVAQQSYSFARLFTEVFLPNLGISRDEDNTLLQFALAECDQEVLALMKGNKCIPASPRGYEYKRPSDLFDPNALGELFSEEEGFFPSHSFLKLLNDRQKGTLRDIGSLKTTLQWTDLIERAKTIPYLWNRDKHQAFQRFNALIKAIEGKLGDDDPNKQAYKKTFKQISFIPSKDQHLHQHLKCANEVFPKIEEDLVGTVSSIVDCDIPWRVKKYLDLDEKKPNACLVLENLSNIAKQKGLGPCFRQAFHLRQICFNIYRYLQGKIHDGDVVTFLREKDCFLVGETFVSAKKLSFSNNAVPPYMYQVNTDLREFTALLKTANVKDTFDAEDLIKVLHDVQAEFFNHPLRKTILDDVLAKVIKPLANKLESSDFVLDNSTEILLPDSEGILRPSSQLAFCDVEWLNSKEVILCHKDIPSSQAVLLGVRDIRHQLLENCSEAIPGEEFGQREELTSRLKRILTGYPCDFSILKELLQNADDAGASEVHFILDKENYPTKSLLKGTMKGLQGPALIAFNNKPFTNEDIRGIQKLGEGSKRESTDKTGRYGVGFNVIYHLTDCPMFMSSGEQICVMDPTLQYVPGATVKSPGRKYSNVRDGLRSICPDFMECFLSFCDLLELDNGTLFRFPLRKEESELSNEEWSPQKVQRLLDSFKEEMFDVLLFLKNVEKISISTKEKDCTELRNTYTVETHLSNQEQCERLNFYKHLSDHANTPIMQIPAWSNCCEVVVKGSDGYQENWIVQQNIGLDKRNIPTSISEALQSGRADMKFLPKGGVASRLSTKCAEPNSGFDQKSRKLEHKVFCFLPLPLSTNLPVHIDGYFALDHEARRNLWYGPVGDPKSDWNRLIKERVIAQSYVQLLREVKKRVITLIEENKNQLFVKKVLNNFHSLFPNCDKQTGHDKVDLWNCVSVRVYTEIIKEKYQLFPVVSYFSTADSADKKVQVNWRSCMGNANDSGYFDDLHRTFHNKPRRENPKEDWEVLQELLLRLEFPLLLTPLTIYNSIVNALDKRDDELCFDENAAKGVLKVSPDSVINFLKEKALFESLKGLPKELAKTPVKTIEELHILMEYVKKVEKYETKLDGLPLLLTCDGVLRSFSNVFKVFFSGFQCLLPSCKNEFLHEQFRLVISKESDVFKMFQISDLSERLGTQLSETVFCSGDLVPWSHGPLKRTNITPSVKWFRQFWKFLSKREAQFESREAFVKQCMTYLGKWSLIPVTVKKEFPKGVTYLIPLVMGKAVLSSDLYEADKNVYDILVNLQAPNLNLAILRSQATFSISTPYSFSRETFLEIPKAFVTKVENRGDLLYLLDYLLKENYEGFSSLKKDESRCILEHMGKGSSQLVKTHGDSVLKRLPCYETIQGNVVAINRRAYSIAISNLPAEGNEVWLAPSKSIFLKKDKIPEELSKALNVEELNEVELYGKFILPYFTSFSENTIWYHLGKIMNMVLHYHETKDEEEKETLIEKLSLRRIPLIINRRDQIKVANELFDPEHDVFKVMLTEDCFPAMFKKDNAIDQTRWLTFLTMIGMRTEATSSQFLKFAEDVSIDLCDPHKPNCRGEPEGQRDRVLFEHLKINHKLHSDVDLLDKLSNIPFISSNPPDGRFCKLFAPVPTKKVTPSTTIARKCALVWSIEPLCPDWIDSTYPCFYRPSKRTTCTKRLREKLGINTRPSLTAVIKHTQTICNSLAFADNVKGKAVTFHENILIEIICKIFKFLSSQCSNGKDLQKVCCSTINCCRNCKLISEQLASVPVVPVDGGKVLSKANMVVKNMITEENCDIFLYLKKLPDELVPYYSTLQCIGATEQPTLEQYARVLETISGMSDVTSDPNLIAAAKQAMSGFLRCLYRKQHNEHTIQTLLAMPTLYLMSKRKDEPIVRSSSLFFNDVAQFNKRLSEFPHPLLKEISPREVGTSVNLEELLKILPGHLRPRFVSEFVEERMVTSVENAEEDCNCLVSRKLKRIASWEQFPIAIQCIVAHELKTGSSAQIDEKMEELMRSRLTIKCIQKLETALYFEGRQILFSQSNTSSLFAKNQENQEVVIYMSHDANPLNMHRQLARNFNDTFKLVRDISYLELILRAENEEDLPNLLNSENIGTARLEEESFWNLPDLGSNVQNDVIALLNRDIMYIFFDNEFVGYDCGDGENEFLVYARVSQRIDDGTPNDTPWRIHYEVKVGENEKRIVPAFRLYKFIPVDPLDRYALTVYTGPSGDSAERQNVSGAERPEEGTEELPDLDATKREVTTTLKDVTTMPEADKKKIIRRLLLKWHPDKNLNNKQFAQEIFKHIQTELEQLQNVNIFSRESFYADVHQRARQDEEEQRHWREQYKASCSARNKRRRRHQEDYGFYHPPTFHKKKNTLEARRHLKQARVDLEVADRLENSTFCCQWKCQLYFFASEKAIKAAQLATGKNTTSESGILKAAESLQGELDLTNSVRGLVDIVKKDSHYPDSVVSPSIPQDAFIPEQALEARVFSNDILSAVARLIGYDKD